MLVELLESEPTWADFSALHRAAVALIPRLRERVVEPALPIGQPRWSPDPAFDLAYHVRDVDLGGSASRADLLAYCETELSFALDPHRPPWVVTLVRGLEKNQSAYVAKCHHSLTDGMGLVQLMYLLHNTSATESAASFEPAAPRPAVTPIGLLAQAVAQGAVRSPGVARSTVGGLWRVLREPKRNAGRAVRYGQSLGRLLGTMPVRSPLLAGGGHENRLLMFDLDLQELKAAGRSVGGSVNDAYVAGMLGGLRIYHEKYGVDVDRIPIAMPVSLRSKDDPAGGNRFAGVRFAGPISVRDPGERIRAVGAFVRGVRAEPAIAYLDAVSAPLSRLPKPALIEVTARATTATDLQISNIPGLNRPSYLAGARVLGTYPFGPRPGVAAMVTLMTLEGRCNIGLNLDATAFPDVDLLHQCLEAGFREVLDLANAKEA